MSGADKVLVAACWLADCLRVEGSPSIPEPDKLAEGRAGENVESDLGLEGEVDGLGLLSRP